MSEPSKISRRGLLITGAAGVAAATVGVPSGVRAIGEAVPLPTFSGLKSIRAGVLNVGYHEAGPRGGREVILLHGFPYDVHSYIDVVPMLARRGFRVIVPHLRGHGATTFLESSTPRAGQQASIGQDLLDFLDALQIKSAIFAGYDWGGRAACVAAALWPERCAGLVSVNGYLVQDLSKAAEPAPAAVERGFWYQFYFQTERGRAGLAAHRKDIGRIMWHDNSPAWDFDEATYSRSAASFDNSDYVDVVIHSYRHRLGGARGYAQYQELEDLLARQPTIIVPTVTLDGDSDGVIPPTDGTPSALKFPARRSHHIVRGVGHNLPQEAPDAFVDAILEVSS